MPQKSRSWRSDRNLLRALSSQTHDVTYGRIRVSTPTLFAVLNTPRHTLCPPSTWWRIPRRNSTYSIRKRPTRLCLVTSANLPFIYGIVWSWRQKWVISLNHMTDAYRSSIAIFRRGFRLCTIGSSSIVWIFGHSSYLQPAMPIAKPKRPPHCSLWYILWFKLRRVWWSKIFVSLKRMRPWLMFQPLILTGWYPPHAITLCAFTAPGSYFVLPNVPRPSSLWPRFYSTPSTHLSSSADPSLVTSNPSILNSTFAAQSSMNTLVSMPTSWRARLSFSSSNTTPANPNLSPSLSWPFLP